MAPKRLFFYAERAQRFLCDRSLPLLAAAFGIAIGVFLRLYRIGDQPIWDDEWHGVHVALLHPLGYIFTHFHPDDNCIPLSAYFRLLLDSVGLNELLIRIPSLLPGILMLVFFPIAARKLLNEKIAVAFLLLLSASPLLVYFSRLARPYSFVIFASFISVVAFYLWMREGKAIFALIYIAGAILTPYFSLSALGLVLAPIVFSSAVLLMKRFGRLTDFANPKPKHILAIALMVLAGIAIWMFPASGTLAAVTGKGGQGFVDFGTLGGCLVLFVGSRSYAATAIAIVLCIYGAFTMYSQKRRLFVFLAVVCALQLLFVVFSRPFLVQSSFVMVRYLSCLLPFWLIFISAGVFHLALKSMRLPGMRFASTHAAMLLILLCLLSGLLWSSPIRSAYGYANSFTNHVDFQYNYLRSGFTVEAASLDRCPEFYSRLAAQIGDAVAVEFPAIVSWSYNPFHIYQKLHGKGLIIGYWNQRFGPFFGYKIPASGKLDLHNHVDLADIRQVRRSGADWIIVHKNIYEEAAAVRRQLMATRAQPKSPTPYSTNPIRNEMQEYVIEVRRALKIECGPPLYEDEWIAVYPVAAKTDSDMPSRNRG